MANPYILVAPNGARRSKADHPNLPITIEEILKAATTCHHAGADGLHLHVRDDQGQHSIDAGRYRETIAALKAEVPALDIQITTESADRFSVADQFNCLRDVRPQWASISVRELARDMDLAKRVYALCADQGTRVQHILYDAQDAERLTSWQTKHILRPDQTDRILVIGRKQGGPHPKPVFPDQSQRQDRWMLCAFGPHEHLYLAKAAELGGDVRVGFENALVDETGQPWPDNAASVAALVHRLKGCPG